MSLLHSERELLRGCPERDLGEDLVAEGTRHDEGGVTGGAAVRHTLISRIKERV